MELDQEEKIRAFSALNTAREAIAKAAEGFEELYATGCLRLREDEIESMRRAVKGMASARKRILDTAENFEGIKPNEPTLSPFQQKEVVPAKAEGLRPRRLQMPDLRRRAVPDRGAH